MAMLREYEIKLTSVITETWILKAESEEDAIHAAKELGFTSGAEISSEVDTEILSKSDGWEE